MAKPFPWKIGITVASLTAISLVALAVGQLEIALLAVGGLVGALGRWNGANS